MTSDDGSRLISLVALDEWLDNERSQIPDPDAPDYAERAWAARGRLAKRALGIMLAADTRVISEPEARELLGRVQEHLQPSDWVRVPFWVSRLAPLDDPDGCYSFLMEWLEMERSFALVCDEQAGTP